MKIKKMLFALLIIATTLSFSACSKKVSDEKYLGEWLDQDVNEPGLTISKNNDNTYSVIISIYRLTYIDDGIGTLTNHGLTFKATDANGNPISGIITIDAQEKEATVKFTDSTWGYINNGDTFTYVRSYINN